MINEVVSTVMRLSGAQAYSAGLDRIGMSAQQVSGHVASLTSRLPGLNTAIAALGGGITIAAVTRLGSQFENTQQKLAGFMTALGQSPDFVTGLKLADTVMQRIELKAAALPGEAEDYVRVFTTALPSVQKSLGGTLDQMIDFSNTMAAVGATFGIDSMQIANDLKRMLQVGRGGAGLDVRTFTEMLPFLQQIEGQANLTTESFNKMTAPKRAELLQQAIGQLQPMIDAASGSWDAMSGTVAAVIKTVTRLSTTPLFEGLKEGAGAFAGLLMDANGSLTPIAKNIVATGQYITTWMVGGVQKLIDGVQWLGDNGIAIFDRLFSAHVAVFEKAFAFDPTSGTFVGPVVDAASTLIDVFNLLSSAVMPLWDAFQMLRATTELVVVTALPFLADAILSVVEPLINFGVAAFTVSSEIVRSLWPAIQTFVSGIGSLVSAIASVLSPILSRLGYELLVLMGWIRDYVVPVFGFLADRIGVFAQDLAEIIRWLGSLIGQKWGTSGPMNQQAPRTGNEWTSKLLGAVQDQMRTWSELRSKLDRTQQIDLAGVSGRKMQAAIPGARGSVKVTQDFRNSRFTIQQEFAEGYDPDRIATAFARDLQRAGEQRLQSGFEPLFIIR